MTKYTFKPEDFKAFNVQEGLRRTNEALNEYIRPQLHELGEYFSDFFTSQTGETFYTPHVAKHARRSVIFLKIHGLLLQQTKEAIKCYLISKLVCLKINCLLCLESCMKQKIKQTCKSF